VIMVIGLFTGCDIYICMYVVSEMRLLISVDVNSLDSLLAVTTAAGCWPVVGHVRCFGSRVVWLWQAGRAGWCGGRRLE